MTVARGGDLATRVRKATAAKAAKVHARKLFSEYGKVAGVGLIRSAGPTKVKVNFESLAADRESLPTQVDGFPVVVEVVGRVRRLGRSGPG